MEGLKVPIPIEARDDRAAGSGEECRSPAPTHIGPRKFFKNQLSNRVFSALLQSEIVSSSLIVSVGLSARQGFRFGTIIATYMGLE